MTDGRSVCHNFLKGRKVTLVILCIGRSCKEPRKPCTGNSLLGWIPFLCTFMRQKQCKNISLSRKRFIEKRAGSCIRTFLNMYIIMIHDGWDIVLCSLNVESNVLGLLLGLGIRFHFRKIMTYFC